MPTAVLNAVHQTRQWQSFGKALIDQPVMTSVRGIGAFCATRLGRRPVDRRSSCPSGGGLADSDN